MEINIIENNNLLNMIYINTNEEVSNNRFIKTISGNFTKNNFLDDANYYTINNLTKNNTLECFEIVSKDNLKFYLTVKDYHQKI